MGTEKGRRGVGSEKDDEKKEERDELKVWEEAVKARGVWCLIKFRGEKKTRIERDKWVVEVR